MVGYKLDGNVTDAITLRSTVLDLLHFRRGLQQRAMRIPPTPYDVELRRHWASFAATAGLELDPLRAVLHGVVRGVPIEVAQEAAPGRFQLAVRVARSREPEEEPVGPYR